MNAAREKMREAAAQAASGATAGAQAEPVQQTAPQSPPVCHVGCVFALSIESGGLVDRLAGVVSSQGEGFTAREGGYEGRRVVLFEGGVGRNAATHATEALIVGHRPRWILSAGFAGGLDDRLAQGDILMADQVVDAEGQRLEIDFKLDPAATAATRHLHVGRLLTLDRIVDTAAEKRALGEQYDALAVDMETSAVAAICRREKVRFLAVRVISDTIDHTLPRDIDRLVRKTTTAGRLGAAAGAILRRPASIKDMWQLKEDALVASERLASFLTGVIGQLPKE